MIDFNPFNCDIQNINESKLNVLIENSIAESWYIEYKDALINDSKKLAKSISAFANAEGGWYFMGVKSDQKTNEAIEISGVDTSEERDLADRISKMIIGNISPKPDFEIKIIELNSGKSVIIIKVEEGIEPPYITSSGTILQREHNANNPVRDRYLIEKMYEKAKVNQERLERFTSFDYGETKGQGDSDQAYLELYLFPSPYNSFSFERYFEPDFFTKVADSFFNGMAFTLDIDGEKYETGLNLSFNAIYSSFDSLVLRPIKDESIIYKGTTVELFRNGNMKLLLPLYTFKLKNAPHWYDNSEALNYLLDRFCPFEEKYEQNFYPLGKSKDSPNKILERKDSGFSDWFQLIDGHELILIVLYMINMYRTILADNDFPEDHLLGFRARIENSWRKMIFFDNSKYLEAIKKFNIPVTPKKDIEIPAFRNGNYLRVDNEQYCFVSILEFIFEGIGIPKNEKLDYLEILKTSIQNLKNKSA